MHWWNFPRCMILFLWFYGGDEDLLRWSEQTLCWLCFSFHQWPFWSFHGLVEANHGQISLKWITSEHYQILLLYPSKGWPYKVVGFSTIGCHNTTMEGNVHSRWVWCITWSCALILQNIQNVKQATSLNFVMLIVINKYLSFEWMALGMIVGG
jgi:hypothetical protein